MSKKGIIIFIFVVLLLTGVGVGFWYVRYYKKMIEPIQSQDQQESESVDDLIYSSNNNDFDGDGVTNNEEEKLGLDTKNFDTDGDGISDTLEMEVLKTDPKKIDTDGDGFGDGIEVLNGYNPAGEGRLNIDE